jgi:predicted enzyme related to lactoylglutathione lyase
MFKVKGLRSWNLNADKLRETTAFYRDVLGAEERQQQTIAGAAVVRLRLGGTGIGLFDASHGPRPGVPHHTFDLDGPPDAEKLGKELEAKGAKVDTVRPHGTGPGYSVYVDDPSGNRLELSWDPT